MRRFFAFSLAFIALSGSALGDDRTDCRRSLPERRVAACTALIEAKAGSPKDLAEAFINRAFAHRALENPEAAVADFTSALAVEPQRSALYQGLIHQAKGEWDLAVGKLTEALVLEPRNAIAFNTRGLARNALGDRDGAIADYTEALRHDPGYVAPLVNRATALAAKGRPVLAIADAGELIRLEPNYPTGYAIRGRIYLSQGEYERGFADLTKAIKLDPGDARVYASRGYAHIEKGEFDAAIADLSEAIKLRPRVASYYDNRGLAYARKKERDRALADYNAAIAIDPKSANAFNNRGYLYQSIDGDLDLALAGYSKAIELDPKFAKAFNNRALVFGVRGELDKAIADFDKSIALDPTDLRAYMNRATVHEKRGDIERAQADLRKLLELPAPLEADKQRQEIARARLARLADRSAAARGAPGQRVALVIGNANYQHAGTLANPKNDAVAVAASLRRLGFNEVVEVYDLSREQMSKALKDFGDLAEKSEWALVFFAGHGLELNGATYLVPVDAALKRDTHVTDETLSLTQVQAKVDAASKLGLIILDSCRNNPFAERMVRSAGATRSVGQGLANIEPEGNVLVAYSAKHGTTALDATGANSPFTEALVAHLEEPGLEINFLFRKVRDQVRTKTQRRQEPFL
ncbi:MAG: tetratricopeptide repeat protein, partial [Hyphomicrobiales bacterium]